MKQNPFSQADLDRIAEAVRAAESKTSGEIVPYYVSQSDEYTIADWRGGVVLAAVAMLASVFVYTMSKTWLPYGVLEMSGTTLAAYLLGIVLSRSVTPYRRFLVGHKTIDLRVHQRASLAFLAEEVFKTRERTGILIFLSFFERKVVVLGDAGINAKVKQSEWDTIVRIIVDGVKKGKTTDGLVEAISQCGELLGQHGVDRRRDDTDELSDSLRIG
ncbi:MAG TPA: TPM domain-containing protein [Bacteroidota bacterium]